MTKEILPTSLWILGQHKEHDLKIGSVIIELPNHETLRFLDVNGHFQPAILNQILQILTIIRGGSSNDAIVSVEMIGKFPEFPVDEDILLLQFQKHYFTTTQTVCLPLTQKGQEKANLFSDNMITNKYLQEAEVVLKYTIDVVLEPNNIIFMVHGLGESIFKEEEIVTVKARIL